MKKNEQLLCEAMVRLLEGKLGLKRYDVTIPEDDASGPPVEIRFRLGERRYAIEHTVIEPFSGAIAMEKDFANFVADIEEELRGKLPFPGYYEIIFPENPTDGRHRRTHPALRQHIIAWILRAGAELHAESPRHLDRDHAPFGHRSTKKHQHHRDRWHSPDAHPLHSLDRGRRPS